MSILKNDRPVREDKAMARLRKQQNKCKMLVEIDIELHRQLKKRAADDRTSMKTIVTEALRKYIKI